MASRDGLPVVTGVATILPLLRVDSLAADGRLNLTATAWTVPR